MKLLVFCRQLEKWARVYNQIQLVQIINIQNDITLQLIQNHNYTINTNYGVIAFLGLSSLAGPYQGQGRTGRGPKCTYDEGAKYCFCLFLVCLID